MNWLLRTAWSIHCRLAIGAAALIAVTSGAAAISVLRHGGAAEPYVWIANPLGSALVVSFFWHTLLGVSCAMAIGLASTAGDFPRVRGAVTLGVLALAALAMKDSAVYFSLRYSGRIASGLPVPLSLYVSLACSTIAWLAHTPSASDIRPARARYLAHLVGSAAGACLLLLAHLVSFGATNYTRDADAAIVLGAKVYSDGTPSLCLSDRLSTGIKLYKTGRVRYLLVTGGTGAEGYNEAAAMRDVAMAAGVPEKNILVDPLGLNTLASARNCRSIIQEYDIRSVLLVSHYYHLARCKMLFTDQGVCCATVPAEMTRRPRLEPYFVFRECIAYLLYSTTRAGRELSNQW